MTIQTIHRHPLPPFTPPNACVMMLAAFATAWALGNAIYYPNYNNDMWRILGLVFLMMLSDLLIARIKPLIKMLLGNFWLRRASPSATQPNRWSAKKTTLLDPVLQIVTPADIEKTLKQLPWCHAFITTGKKRLKFYVSNLQAKNTKHWRASTAIDCQPSHWFISLTIIITGVSFGDW